MKNYLKYLTKEEKMTVEILEKKVISNYEKKNVSSLYSEITYIQGQIKANLEMQIHLKEEEMRLEDMKTDLEKEIGGLQND
jgi:exonuclease VII large subunit